MRAWHTNEPMKTICVCVCVIIIIIAGSVLSCLLACVCVRCNDARFVYTSGDYFPFLVSNVMIFVFSFWNRIAMSIECCSFARTIVAVVVVVFRCSHDAIRVHCLLVHRVPWSRNWFVNGAAAMVHYISLFHRSEWCIGGWWCHRHHRWSSACYCYCVAAMHTYISCLTNCTDTIRKLHNTKLSGATSMHGNMELLWTAW